ncbi:MAG: hypothetical protein ABI045_05360 [Flavobacteriales bacterium]
MYKILNDKLSIGIDLLYVSQHYDVVYDYKNGFHWAHREYHT